MNDWYKKAVDKLTREKNGGSYGRHEAVMKDAVHAALLDFCQQDEEFAQAVAQGGTFADCMKAVARKGCDGSKCCMECHDGAKCEYYCCDRMCSKAKAARKERQREEKEKARKSGKKP